MALLNFGGLDLPAPTGYRVSNSDIDAADSGRSETGIMNRNRVRAGVAKIECEWKNLTADELSLILSAAQPAEIVVQYFFGSIKTATMYAGDRSIELKSIAADGATSWDLSFNVVEI